ncbi:MAG: hypothetical protein LAP40_08295 [Acidobacteriia bacterium]|nr:hypothetical protein [Terriglobia bacterium]
MIAFQPGSYVPKFVRRQHLQPPTEVAAQDLDPDTVAVLPFVNLSADPEQVLFCNGTTEEIIFELASVPGLKVLGLTTAFALRDCKEGFMTMCSVNPALKKDCVCTSARFTWILFRTAPTAPWAWPTGFSASTRRPNAGCAWDVDRQTYLRLLVDTLSEAHVRMLGWCLMTNHVHLIVPSWNPG